MTLTIDASVALKWVLAEEGSDRALALVGAAALVAPDFLMLECANVLAQQVRRKLLTADQADFFVRELGAVDVRLVSSASLVPQAHRLAVALQQSVYDSLYLAVALAEGATLVTADNRFADAAMGHPLHRTVVRRL